VKSNYIFKYKGSDNSVLHDLQLIRGSAGVRILDESALPNMILIEAGNEAITQLQQLLKNWKVIPEIQIPLPNTKLKLGKPKTAPARKIRK
jgi:hypothetical protein